MQNNLKNKKGIQEVVFTEQELDILLDVFASAYAEISLYINSPDSPLVKKKNRNIEKQEQKEKLLFIGDFLEKLKK